jgi:hypothetical protein
VIAQSVYRWATGWTIGILGFDSRRGRGIFLFTTASRTVLGPTQPPIQWVPGALSLGVKRPGCQADHSPPSSAEVEEWVELYPHSPNTPSWRSAQLRKISWTNLPLLLIIFSGTVIQIYISLAIQTSRWPYVTINFFQMQLPILKTWLWISVLKANILLSNSSYIS